MAKKGLALFNYKANFTSVPPYLVAMCYLQKYGFKNMGEIASPGIVFFWIHVNLQSRSVQVRYGHRPIEVFQGYN